MFAFIKIQRHSVWKKISILFKSSPSVSADKADAFSQAMSTVSLTSILLAVVLFYIILHATRMLIGFHD